MGALDYQALLPFNFIQLVLPVAAQNFDIRFGQVNFGGEVFVWLLLTALFQSTSSFSAKFLSASFPPSPSHRLTLRPLLRQTVPRFQRAVDRAHRLYRLHAAALRSQPERHEQVRVLEQRCVPELDQFLEQYAPDKAAELRDLFKDCVESELQFYK